MDRHDPHIRQLNVHQNHLCRFLYNLENYFRSRVPDSLSDVSLSLAGWALRLPYLCLEVWLVKEVWCLGLRVEVLLQQIQSKVRASTACILGMPPATSRHYMTLMNVNTSL